MKARLKKKKSVRYNSRFAHSDFLLGTNLKPIYDSDLQCVRSPQLRLCQRLSFPEPRLHSWMAARQAPLAVKRAQHLYLLCNNRYLTSKESCQCICKQQWKILARGMTETFNTDHEWDRGESLGIISRSCWDVERSVHVLSPLITSAFWLTADTVAETKTPFNETPNNTLKTPLIKLIQEKDIPAKNNKLIIWKFQTPLFSAPRLIQT